MSTPRADSAPAAPGDLGARPRPGSRTLFRRIAAALTTIVLGTGIAVVGAAAPASAHHNTITASAVCSTNGKTADITWSVTNSERIEETITESSLEKVVKKGTKIGANATENFIQEGVELGDRQKLELAAKWSNGQKKADSFSYTPSSDLCGDGDGGDTVCDPFDTGHLSAGNAVSYPITAPEGKLIAEVCVKAGSKQQGNGPEYTTLPTPSKTTTITHSSGKQISHYSVRYVNAPKVITIEVEPSSVDLCGVASDTFTQPTDTDRIDWSITGSVAEGQVVLTAAAKAGFVFADGVKVVWTFTFTDDPCVVDVVGAPSFSDTCGPDNDELIVPTDTATIDWNSVEADGNHVVTATAKAGFTFPAGAKTSWEFPIDDEPCVILVEGVPSFTDSCGPDNDTVELPTDTDAIAWTKAEVDGKWIVTATAKAGLVLPEGATVTWTFTIDDSPCVIELVGAPTFSDTCGPGNQEFDYPEDTDTIVWSEVEAGGVIAVTATARAGFTFPEGTTASWEYVLDDEECAEPSLAGSVVTGVCLADAPWIFYEITLTDPDNQSDADHASLVFTDGVNTETVTLGTLDENGVLDGKVLWPGASVADDGVTPTGWPGWAVVDGEWVETDDNLGWTRDRTTATLVVNPDLEVAIAYPPATPDCVAGPPRDDIPDHEVSAASGMGLASTGFAGATIAIVAGIIVVAGLAFLVIARMRRTRQ